MAKIKYLTKRFNELYYQRAVPTRIQKAIGKKVVKQKLDLNTGSSTALITAKIAEIDEQYQAWFDNIQSDNNLLLTEIDKRNAAMAYLSDAGLKVGELSSLEHGTLSDINNHDLYVSSIMDEKFSDISAIGYKLAHNTQLTPEEQIVEYAWFLATEPQKLQLPAMFSDAWAYYAKIKGFDLSYRRDLKHKQSWDRFINIVGNQPLTTANIREAQAKFAADKLKDDVKPQSIKRGLTTVLAAFNAYVEEHQLEVLVKRYKIQQAPVINERVSFNEKQLCRLWELLIDRHSNISDEVRLALSLMIQSSLIASEVQRMAVSDLVIKGHSNYEGVAYVAVRTGKTKDRIRPVPIVVGLELIEELAIKVKDGKYLLGRLSTQTESSMSRQLNNIIKQVDDDLTSYSLRHGWLDRALNKDVPESVQDRVGGWSGGNNSKKRGYAKLADTSLDRLRNYAMWQQKINSCLLGMEGKVIELFA
jgi:integrase